MSDNLSQIIDAFFSFQWLDIVRKFRPQKVIINKLVLDKGKFTILTNLRTIMFQSPLLS